MADGLPPVTGLSPLARETPHTDRGVCCTRRFIPAGAGNTCIGVLALRNVPVYPRWRGEHANFAIMTLMVNGLSPLARGTLTRFVCRDSAPRFIPAGAGNTQTPCANKPINAVYPRWRGEHWRRTDNR